MHVMCNTRRVKGTQSSCFITPDDGTMLAILPALVPGQPPPATPELKRKSTHAHCTPKMPAASEGETEGQIGDIASRVRRRTARHKVAYLSLQGLCDET